MTKIVPEHLARLACVYIRQSTADQLLHNEESQRRQYGLADRARALGWSSVERAGKSSKFPHSVISVIEGTLSAPCHVAAISGTSAGALNAALTVSGLVQGGRVGARIWPGASSRTSDAPWLHHKSGCRS
jgi:hypothetical protein